MSGRTSSGRSQTSDRNLMTGGSPALSRNPVAIKSPISYRNPAIGSSPALGKSMRMDRSLVQDRSPAKVRQWQRIGAFCKHHLMAMFACWSSLLVRKKKKSKGFSNDAGKKGSNNGDLRVKPIDLVSPSSSTDNGMKEQVLTDSKSFPSVAKRSSIIPKVRSEDSLATAESTGDAAYEGGDEHEEIRTMKKENSDLDLQPKGGLSFHGSNTDSNSYEFRKTETNKGIAGEAQIASGHVSDPGMERTAFLESPVLKRSCSNIETKQAKQWIKSPKRSSSYSNLQNLPGNCRVEITYENYSSPLSLRSSCSADHVMLKRRSSSQVLPSRSRKIWWKLFLWSHRNLHEPRAPQRQISILSAPKRKDGYSSDTHEPGQKLDKGKKTEIEPENHHWVAFSVGSSHMDRVNAWVNSLEDCSFVPINVEEDCDAMEDEKSSNHHHLGIKETSEKVCSHTSRHAAEDVAQADNIIQSLNTFSSAAHISGIGLKVIPSISAFASLRSVNLSGNSIVHITSGSLPKNLHTLDLSRNKISTIEGFRELERLRILNLSYNRITRIGHDEFSVSEIFLHEVILLSTISMLHITFISRGGINLNVQGSKLISNRRGPGPARSDRGVKGQGPYGDFRGHYFDYKDLIILCCFYSGLSSCTIIRELYLAGNKISNVEGLHRLLKLTVLDLSFNKITTAKALGQLVANYNSLLALNLLGNPIQTNIGEDQLRKAVLSLLPHVTYLNKQLIKPHKVREVVTKSVTKAALGDVARSSRRKLTRRLSQGSGSATKSRVGEGSFRAIKHGKSRHSTSGRK
ncbi:putative disease resistance protein [Dendrobium catenatum]|uniref:Putative disease resistance protein n=1 Tax=Dendrobium catenatum TaxID=906689 RepID=A0A2I0WZX7_9ASPA|nr:putative disease resistance protein [Dendrobium catenatum]